MNQSTVDSLNQLNHHFYLQTIVNFDRTRRVLWPGWDELEKYFHTLKRPIHILDVGCGNGRFIDWLQQRFRVEEFFYLGIDANEQLLEKAQQRYSSESISFQHHDLLVQEFPDANSFQPDVIVLFGVLHHIPSYERRIKLLSQLSEKLSPQGYLIVSLWQFLTQPRLQRIIHPWSKQTHIDQSQLEEGDYLLGWNAGVSALRYCHSFSESEIEQLKADLSPLQCVKAWEADGRNGRTNQYLIWQKS